MLIETGRALGGTNVATYGYAYDVDNSTGLSTMLGQKSSLTANVPAQGFANALTKYYYDALYQLTRADYPNVAPFGGEVDSWSYDDIGNRLTNTVNGLAATYTYLKNGANPLNGQRLSNDGTNAYTWDNNGSNLTRNGPPGNFTFGYSVDNRLSSIAGAATATYTYDYQGRRSSKTVGAVTTTYLYDGLNLVTETTAGNPVNYAFGPGIDEPLATYQSGTLGYFAPDALGTVGVVSSPTGTVQNTYVFDVWGSAKASSATLTNSFGYTAREVGEAGLLAYRARYLQPGVGRFNQEDPLSSAGGRAGVFEGTLTVRDFAPQFSRDLDHLGFKLGYAYTQNKPLIFSDPDGLAGMPPLPPIKPGAGWHAIKCVYWAYICRRDGEYCRRCVLDWLANATEAQEAEFYQAAGTGHQDDAIWRFCMGLPSCQRFLKECTEAAQNTFPPVKPFPSGPILTPNK